MKKVFFIISTILIFGIVASGNYQKIRNIVLSPSLKVVNAKFTSDASTSTSAVLLVANVKNIGGDGNVVVEAIVRYGDNKWDKKQEFKVSGNQNVKCAFEFNDITVSVEDLKYDIKTYELVQ